MRRSGRWFQSRAPSYSDNDLEDPLWAVQKLTTTTVSPPPPPPPPPPPVKTVIRLVKEIAEHDIMALSHADPALVKALFVNRLHIVSARFYPPRDWLIDNCTGRFAIRFIDSGSLPNHLRSIVQIEWSIGFENEDDLVLFKTKYSGVME